VILDTYLKARILAHRLLKSSLICEDSVSNFLLSERRRIPMTPLLVMLVDDEAPFVETMTKRLEKRNLDITSALSGQAALDMLSQRGNIDVVILDVKMPGMDGLETLQKIKVGYPLTEVIMLTAHATVESAIEGMKLGAFDYLMKPCNMDRLMEIVKEASRKKRNHEEKIREARVKELLSTRGF